MAKPEQKGIVLGFLTVRETEASSLRGGYLLTSEFGRPLEFHYTSVLRVSPLHRALHGVGFESHLYSQVLGLPLTERQATPPQMIFVDHPALLELRQFIPAPVVQLGEDAETFLSHEKYPQDALAVEKLRTLLPVSLNLREPFERIDQAFFELRDRVTSIAA